MGWADSPPLSPDGGGILSKLLFIICIEILRRLSIDIHEEVYIKETVIIHCQDVIKRSMIMAVTEKQKNR